MNKEAIKKIKEILISRFLWFYLGFLFGMFIMGTMLVIDCIKKAT